MKWIVLLVLGAAAMGSLALLARRAAAGTNDVIPSAGGTAWLLATGLLLVAAVCGAHLLGLFGVPLVAFAFIFIGVPARTLLMTSRAARERRRARELVVRGSTAANGRPLAVRFLARHELAIMAALVTVVAVAAAAAGSWAGQH